MIKIHNSSSEIRNKITLTKNARVKRKKEKKEIDEHRIHKNVARLLDKLTESRGGYTTYLTNMS